MLLSSNNCKLKKKQFLDYAFKSRQIDENELVQQIMAEVMEQNDTGDKRLLIFFDDRCIRNCRQIKTYIKQIDSKSVECRIGIDRISELKICEL